jgi:NADH-quinone oxidoreductase subunit K
VTESAVPLSWFLATAAVLFSIGLFTVVSRRNAIGALMGVELMLNAVNVNLAAFWRYQAAAQMNGIVFVILLFAAAAAETAVGLALIVSIYRLRATVQVEDADLMRG